MTTVIAYMMFTSATRLVGAPPTGKSSNHSEIANRGVFMISGREEDWTLSMMHTDEAADDSIAVFEELAADLTA